MIRNGFDKNKCVGRTLLGVACLAFALFLGGCGYDYPQLSAEDTDRVSEYAANLLLKYDSGNRSRLLSLEEMEKEKERLAAWEVPQIQPTPEASPDPNDGNIGGTEGGEKEQNPEQKYSRLEDFYGLPDGVEISYSSFDQMQSYEPSNASFFSLEAQKGKELLVLYFDLNNTTDGAQSIDFLSDHATYLITVNNSFTRVKLTTLLDNDLATYQGKLMPGESQKLVLLAEIDEGMDITSLILWMKKEDQDALVLLK